MSVSTPGRPGRPNDPVVLALVVTTAVLLGILATTSPAWAIGIPVTLVALPVIHRLTSSSSGESD